MEKTYRTTRAFGALNQDEILTGAPDDPYIVALLGAGYVVPNEGTNDTMTSPEKPYDGSKPAEPGSALNDPTKEVNDPVNSEPLISETERGEPTNVVDEEANRTTARKATKSTRSTKGN